MHGHEDTRSTELMGAVLAQSLDLLVGIHLVELQDSKLHLLPLMLNLFWLRVCLLLTLLGASKQVHGHEDSGFICDARRAKDVTVCQRLAAVRQPLFFSWDSLGAGNLLLQREHVAFGVG